MENGTIRAPRRSTSLALAAPLGLRGNDLRLFLHGWHAGDLGAVSRETTARTGTAVGVSARVQMEPDLTRGVTAAAWRRVAARAVVSPAGSLPSRTRRHLTRR
jgi:hypothetical protein